MGLHLARKRTKPATAIKFNTSSTLTLLKEAIKLPEGHLPPPRRAKGPAGQVRAAARTSHGCAGAAPGRLRSRSLSLRPRGGDAAGAARPARPQLHAPRGASRRRGAGGALRQLRAWRRGAEGTCPGGPGRAAPPAPRRRRLLLLLAAAAARRGGERGRCGAARFPAPLGGRGERPLPLSSRPCGAAAPSAPPGAAQCPRAPLGAAARGERGRNAPLGAVLRVDRGGGGTEITYVCCSVLRGPASPLCSLAFLGESCIPSLGNAALPPQAFSHKSRHLLPPSARLSPARPAQTYHASKTTLLWW